MIKKLLSLLVFMFFINANTYSQCAAIGNNACTSAAPTIINNSVTCTTPSNQGGRRNFQVSNMIAGATYRVSNCGSGLDTQMTIRDAGGISVGYNDDNGPACAGTAASIDFIPPATGTYRIQINKYFCAISPNTSNGDIVVTLLSDPPTPIGNDDPCTSVALTVNPDFSCSSTTSGTILGATNSGINPCFGTSDDDVWYHFVATNTSHTIDLINITGGTTDLYHAVYGPFANANTPNCLPATVNAANISCSDPNSSSLGGLIIGQTYFVQVYSWTGTSGQTSNFDICIGTPPPGPSNDDPCGSINLTVNPDFSCTNTTSGTITSATNSGINPCFGTSDDDVWYHFVATGPSHTLDLLNITGGTTDLYHAVYGPFANANLPNCTNATVGASNISCSDPNSSTITGLVAGQTYFVQVYSWTSTSGQTSNFDICIGTPPPPPGNDEPCGSINLTVNPDFSCSSTTSGSIASSTNSGVNPCFGTSDDDVWFHFVASGPSHTVDLLNITGTTTDLYHAVYGPFANANPPNCTNATVGASNISCSDPNSSTLTGLITGQTYFVQVYSWTSISGQTSNFDICIGTPPPPPTNDDPCGAVSLTVNSTCIGTSGTVGSATDSGIDSCFGTPDNDVWYSFVATDPFQTVSLFNVFGSTTDMYHAVYGPFTPPDCSVTVGDNISCNDSDSTDLTGLTVGATYFVQVFTYFSGSETTSFDICVTEPCSNSVPINNVPTVCPLIAGEEGVDPFVDPFDPDPSFSLDCANPNLTLEAYSTIRTTDSYIVEQIAYTNPDYFPTGFSTPQVINTDDVWADDWTTLPFNFCFYGNTYTEVLVGANGMITFDNANVAGSFCGWQFDNNLPSTVGALFNNTIYGVYHDIDPTGISNPTESWIQGSPGCRRFITAWRGVPLFGDATPSREYTGMVVLHETTNIIEVFIENKRIENGNVGPWNDGNAIVGLQGNSSTGEYITAPCRNGLDTNWEATNEAWRFVPNGTIIAPDLVEWFSASTGSMVIGTGSTLPITTPDTYTAEVTYTSCGATVTFSDDVVVGLSAKTWTGALNTNWYEDANWIPAAIPTPADCVLIPDTSAGSNRYPIADVSNRPIPLPPPSAYALNLTVDVGASIEVLADTELVVTDWVNLNGTINIRSTGSLIQINDGAVNVNNNIGTGTINMERTVSGIGSYDYVYWSTPVEGFGVGGVSPGSTHIYEWDPNIPTNGVGGYGDWLPTSEIMQNGKGYIIRNILGTPTPLTPVFSGKPNNGIITKAITRGTYNIASPGGDYPGPGETLATRLDDNWNLIGNPYPSAISATDFIFRNASVISDDSTPVTTGAIYLWRHLAAPSNTEDDPFYGDFVYNYNPNDYVVYNASGSNPSGQFGGDIAAGQAFFVLMEHSAPRNTSVVRFDNAMRNETLDNSDFIRTGKSKARRLIDGEKHRIWLDLISPGNTANSILVGYIEGATNGEDRMFDANELSETSTRFYSLIENTPLSIQGRALPFVDTDTVLLGIDIPQNGNYSIAINTLDGLFLDSNQEIYLEDSYTNIIHDLRVNPYSFNIDNGTYDDRFTLRYNNESLSIDEFNTSGLEILAPNNAYIKVKSGSSPINNVIVYDLLSRVLIEKNGINDSEINIETSNYAEGTYIVKAVLADGKQKIQKVVIKN